MSLLSKPQDHAKESPQEKGAEKPKETLAESIAGFASVFIVGLFIITFVIQHFEIPSRSMQQTLWVGDHVFVDRLTPTGKKGFLGRVMPYRDIHRGDTAVFLSPVEPGTYLVKRIIAVPGDRIRLRNGEVYLNGARQSEPYVVRDGSYIPYRDEFPSVSAYEANTAPDWPAVLARSIHDGEVVIPPNHYFAMGDNRDNSYDSRFWGFVPEENIVGRPLFIAWSLNQTEVDFPPNAPIGERIAAFLHTTVHFFGMTRWDRVFHLVR
jgi:signal peptidase I